jgi:hypothetical protein
MTVQPSHVTVLETIEHLDFAFEPPCEHSNHGVAPWHSGPAALVVMTFQHCSGVIGQVALCESAWNYAATAGIHCSGCKTLLPREHAWRFLFRLGDGA